MFVVGAYSRVGALIDYLWYIYKTSKCLHFFASSLHNCGSTIQTTRKSVLKYFKKTKMGQNSISYIGPKVWNKLPSQCKLEKNPNNFKHKIKEFFKNIQHENDDIYIYIYY